MKCQMSVLLILALFGWPFAWAAKPLNIVFILTDNQSSLALGAYGNLDVRTPHIDQLAARGIRFDNAFAVNGMCSPTRATLLSGLIPTQHGLHNALHDAWVDERPSGWNAIQEYRTVPYTLAEHGYQTAMVGKWHIGDPRVAQLGYQYWVALPYGHTVDFWDNQLVINGKQLVVRNQHIVDALADHAVTYLEQVDKNRPFFLQLSLDGPYALPPSNYGPARNRHYTSYVAEQFKSMPVEPVSDNILERLTGPFIPEHAIEHGIEGMSLDEIKNSLYYRTMRMQGHRESYANFLSQNQVVDDAVGKVWQALERLGLNDNTVIIYSADQGNFFGQHGTWGHSIWFWPSALYDAAMRVPLIVYQPGSERVGDSDARLVAQYDIAPTLLDFAGIEPGLLRASPGESFAGAMDNREQGRAAVFFEQEESRGIRTHDYAYYKRLEGMGSPELYDVRKDPHQRHNIYDQYAQEPWVNELDRQLNGFFAEYRTPEYDLWDKGVSKGTNPNPGPWIKYAPWPWLKKFWQDFVTEPPLRPAFDG